MQFFEEIKENIISRIGNARVKNQFGGTQVMHPDNTDKHDHPLPPEIIKEYNIARPRKQKLLCYAPFKNIYFGMDGSASACCYNRTQAFDKYPDKNIHEMWFGEEADKLRDYIRCNDLSLGCEGCKYLLEAKNYTGVQAMYFDHYPVNRNNYPSVMQFELSNVCNLECTMCTGEFSSSIRKNREKLPPKPSVYDDGFIEQLREFIPHLSYAKFYGGEPFLIEIYYAIWDLMAEINPNITVEIQTNGTIMNNKVEKVLNELKCNINISIDSLKKETYESIRVNANYEKVMQNIEAFSSFRKKRGTRITVSMCPMRTNWQELPDFVDYCNANKASLFFHMVWKPEHLTLWNLDSDSLSNILSALSKWSHPNKTAIEKKNRRQYINYLQLIEKWLTNAIIREKDLKLKELETRKKALIEKEIEIESKKKAIHFKPIIEKFGARQALLNELASHMKNTLLINETEIKLKTEQFQAQITWMVNKLPNNIKADDLFESLLSNRPVENILMELEKDDREKLLEIAIIYNRKIEFSKK